MRVHLTKLSVLLTAALLACTVWWAYAPGLYGTFLFDDFGNLPALGAGGPVDNWPTFWRYITSGIADPTGRPLTLLTFLLDARNWPADPFPFKRTNLILHLFNGALLYVLLAKLGQLLEVTPQRCRVAALFGVALWLLHPLLVSTTLYIVQREAMLPATCVLSGLLTWLHGRDQLTDRNLRSGLLWSVLGLGGFTLLGMLAKANGVLLPFYALLIEFIVLAPRPSQPIGNAQRAHRACLLVFAVIPTLLILAYLIWVGVTGILSGGPTLRPWTHAQRLLTEPRVLFDYLQLLWLPRPYSSGLFNDQYTASTSLLHPANTLPAILGVLALLAGAWWLRRRHPALALALLFYFAGQLLESTSIPLELYFEHRNYVSALMMFWPLGLWLADTHSLKVPKYLLLIALPAGLAWMTHARAEIWGNVRQQAMIWAEINPHSARAQTNAAQIEMQYGHPQKAIRRLEHLLTTQPDQVQLTFNLIGARCMTGGISSGDLEAARTAMRTTKNVGALITHWFDRTLPVASSGSCTGLTLSTLGELVGAGLQNPSLDAAGPQQDLIYLRGRIALAQHRPEAALIDFSRALDLQIRPGMALQGAATLGAAGYPAQGLKLLDHYQRVQNQAVSPSFGMPMIHAWILTRQNYWKHELARLRHQLSLDASAANTNTAHPVSEPSRTY